MTAKAIVDLVPGPHREQLIESLRIAGVEPVSEAQGSDEALVFFRAVGAKR